MKRATPPRRNSSGSSAASPSSYAPRWSAASAGTALICQYFRTSDQRYGRYGADQKNAPKLTIVGTEIENAALCTSDSDLLPPRSRYPIKWARNRQPSPPPSRYPIKGGRNRHPPPPPVAFPGPHLSGPPHPPSLNPSNSTVLRAARP